MADPLTLALLGGSAIKGVAGFFGSKSAEKKAKAAAIAAGKAYDTGVTNATNETNTSAATASEFYDPYAEQGGRANTMYGDAVGVNGQPAQAAFFSSFQDDPGFQATLDAGSNQVAHSALFKGGANSGATQKDLFDFGQRAKYSQFQDRLNRLQGLGNQGFQAAGAQSNIETGRGATVADLALKRGAFKAGVKENLGQISANGVAQRTNIIGSGVGDLVSAFGRSTGMSGSSAGYSNELPWAPNYRGF